jgi:heme/copper-type cytochrome/quinol oxidase subunit 4
MCLHVLRSLLWCPFKLRHKNDVPLILSPSCLLKGSCFTQRQNVQNQMKEEQLKLEVRRACSHLTSGVVGLVRRVVTLVVLNQVWCFFEICGRSVFLCACVQLTVMSPWTWINIQMISYLHVNCAQRGTWTMYEYYTSTFITVLRTTHIIKYYTLELKHFMEAVRQAEAVVWVSVVSWTSSSLG